MPEAMTAKAALDRYFLETRCKLIEIAANLDRFDRGAGGEEVWNDPRLSRVQDALQFLSVHPPGSNRAERVQKIFSLPYTESWQPPNQGGR